MKISQTARDQLAALSRHYSRKRRPEAIRNLTDAMKQASRQTMDGQGVVRLGVDMRREVNDEMIRLFGTPPWRMAPIRNVTSATMPGWSSGSARRIRRK